MAEKVFFDTNILIYGYDERDIAKHKTALDLIFNSLAKDRSLISPQVFSEFCNVALVKIPKRMDKSDLQMVLQTFLEPMLAHKPDLEFYNRAIELHAANSLSFYDALIVQAAIDLKCQTLYSEDLQDGQKYGTLTVVNPFKD